MLGAGSGTEVFSLVCSVSLCLCCGLLLCLFLGGSALAQVQVGENTHMTAGGLFTVGYAGDYGNEISSSHGLNFGASGTIDGYYYSPNFLNFQISPYYNQSKADSDYQSLTNASGLAASANFFTGSRFPGSVSYRYDYNSTGTFGLPSTPNFTTQGSGQGFGVNWSALLPGWPTLSVGYQQGSGSGTLYGTNEETSNSLRMFNVHSSYQLEGFNINAYYDHNNSRSLFPEFLTGTDDINHSTGQDMGVSASRNVPWMNGSFNASFNHSSYSSNYLLGSQYYTTDSGYTADTEAASATFHPTQKFGFYMNQNYTNNLSAYFIQGIGNGQPLPPVTNLGNDSYSDTVGGGANYLFTNYLSANAQATHYNQEYYGQSYSGTFLSGTVNYGRRLFDMFTFSTSVVDSANGLGSNNLGFIGTVNYFHPFGQWQTSGSFSYAQNVQSVLITETTSYYYYNANVHRKFSPRVQWTLAFNGNHSGLSSDKNSVSSSAGFSTSVSLRSVQMTANYLTASGNSVLTSGGIVPLPPVPGVPPADLVWYNAKNYGGSLSWTPIRRMVLTGTYSRSYSNTLSNSVYSNNKTNILYSQLQYRLRRISLLAGATRFTQGISAIGAPPGTVTSYYGGISRWFDFF